MDKYQEALKQAKKEYQEADGISREILERIFPGLLQETENERLRKTTISFLEEFKKKGYENAVECIEWLEKQKPIFSDQDQRDPWEYIEKFKELYGHYPSDADEIGVIVSEMIRKQKPNEPEPKKDDHKFKEGDWVISNDGDKLRHTLEVRPGGYMSDYGWLSKDTYESIFRLWTIQDAKPGDVLSWDHERYTIILKEIKDNKIIAWCSYNNHSDYFGTAPSYYDTKFDIELGFKPASTKARETLFAKMWEAGYDWNSGNLSLRKIQENPEGYSDKDMARFIGNAITTDEASGYLKEKHIEVSAAHVWLDRIAYKPDHDQLMALSSAIKAMNPKDSDLLLKLYNELIK